MSSKSRSLLADKVYRFCCDAIGAPEHLQIAEQLAGARKHVISLEAAMTIRASLDAAPWAFEQNLDMIERPDGPEWFEWPLPTRAGHGGGDKATTGCLVLPHPDIDTVVTMITAWVGKKRIARHSYGAAMVDLSDLKVAAYHARNGYSEIAEESMERMMGQIGLAVPLGFQDEIGIMFNRSEGAMEGILRDSSAEIPFVLSILLARQAKGGLVSREAEEQTHLEFGPPAIPGIMERISLALSGAKNLPLRRTVGIMGGVNLRWSAHQLP
ncbi:hypothetical protein G6L37_03730 [Agrobacterium rubi]|nr:hypothetical protein [Agrobacterium rubi]NTF24462.1 hypothetical protein [Agrobacterium rubi]